MDESAEHDVQCGQTPRVQYVFQSRVAPLPGRRHGEMAIDGQCGGSHDGCAVGRRHRVSGTSSPNVTNKSLRIWASGHRSIYF